jgi:lipopolysaccharide export LptBFGC system permease protein LptF
MNVYPVLVLAFSLFAVAFGLHLYSKQERTASLIGSILSLAGLILALITIVAWLLPGFFYNAS